MNPDLQKELFSRLDAFAAKLGVASAHVWGVLAKQSVMDGITDFIWAGSFILLAGVCLYYVRYFGGKQKVIDDGYQARLALWTSAFDDIREANLGGNKYLRSGNWNSYPDEPKQSYDTETIWFCIGATIFTIVALFQLTSGIRHVCNPEFYALQLLIDTVKQ